MIDTLFSTVYLGGFIRFIIMIEKSTYRFIAHPGALEELEGKWVAAKLYDIIMLHDKEKEK